MPLTATFDPGHNHYPNENVYFFMNDRDRRVRCGVSELALEVFDPQFERSKEETIPVMGLAYEMALIALRLGDRGDLANEVVAQKIIALAKAGERDPERLCDGVMKEFGKRPLL